MKITVIALLIFLFTAANAFTQYSALFISPGLAVSKPAFPKVNLDLQYRAAAGFDGGAGAELGISKKFSLQTEINYSMQGINVSSDSTMEFSTILNNYLTVPLLAKFYVSPGFSAFAGPQFGYRVSSRLAGHGGSGHYLLNSHHLIKSTDIYAVAGIEYRFPAGLFVSVRYQFGLTNIDDGLLTIQPDKGFKNRYCSFRFGYSIPFTKLTTGLHP